MSGQSGERRLRVLQSFPQPRATTNPYIVMLADALRADPGIDLHTFSWKQALLGRYDVFHAHWPEILVNGTNPLKASARRVLTVALLVRLRLTRTPIVRTVHNLHLPSGLSRAQRRILEAFDRATTYRIALNPDGAVVDGLASAVILHGHYRDWYSPQPRRERESGRLAFFGQVRGYKNVPALIGAFRATEGLRLTVAGKPTSAALSAEIRAAAEGDGRIDLDLTFLSDAEVVEVVTSAELVVLAYTEMHNSGSVLAALSLDRPVLVPATAVNESLAHEVGAGWVRQYTGELTPEVIGKAMTAVASMPVGTRPDLSRREWSAVGSQHRAAYAAAMQLKRVRAR